MSCLDDMTLSTAQRGAVDDGSPRVLVAAGAGSGKTSLLVAYFLRALLDEGTPVDRLVAVTFTRKAAGELAERIRRELEERGQVDLARSLDGGTIGTIHSLCRRILRQHALEAGVDPGFAVLEPDGAELLKRDALAHVWEQTVQEADVSRLAALGQHERTLRQELIPLYDRLRGVGYEAPRVDLPAPCNTGQVRTALESALRSAIDAGAAQDHVTKTLAKALDVTRQCLEWVCTGDAHMGGRDLAFSSRLFPSRMASFDVHLDPVRRALTEYRHQLALGSLIPLVTAMNDLLERFHHQYGLVKQQRGVLDFADLELLTRRLLVATRDERPSILGDGSRIMIDEFQDTNELQCSILENLGADNVLMVGDERQSIYRFRGADVEVFARRRDSAPSRTPTRAEGAASATDVHAKDGNETLACRVHRLDKNYRSRAQILHFINHLFSQPDFFGRDFVPLECGSEHDDGQVNDTAAVEILAVKREAKDDAEGTIPIIQEAEAQAVAWRVRELLHENDVEPRDVVILSPALTYGDLYQRALRARDVPVYVVRGKGYYSREEIADVRCLLQVLLNPHDDLAFVTVLRSPLVGLSDDALYLLGRRRAHERDESLWRAAVQGSVDVLPPDDRRRFREFVREIAALADRVGRPGLASLIDDAVTSLGYDQSMLAQPGGRRRFANVRKLMRLADEYEQLQGPDLAGFVAVLSTMDELGGQEGNAATLSEEENVVRVMTVHQAKGLEFPVVVLTGLGSASGGRSHPSFVVDNAGRAGVFLRGSRNKTYEDHDLCWGPAIEIVEEEREHDRREDVRLLYVAMTRAEKRLLLVGAAQKEGAKGDSRLSTIVRSLGRGSAPEPGETLMLPEASALARGVSYVDVVGAADGEGARLQPAPAESHVVLAAGTEVGGVETAFMAPSFPQDDHTWTEIPNRLSFSGLASYLECPRRYYLEHIHGLRCDSHSEVGWPGHAAEGGSEEGLQAPQGDLLDGGESADGREVGLLVHALLERSILHGPRPSLEELRILAEPSCTETRAPDAGFERQTMPGQATDRRGLPKPPDLDRALQLTLAFWSSPVAARSGLEGAQKEAQFWFLEDGLLISGIMDLVWENDGRVYVVDYKTNRLRGRLPEEMAGTYSLQASLYALAALRAGASEVQMELLFLEDAENPVAYHWTRSDLADLERGLKNVLGPLRAGEYPARPGTDCTVCQSARLCGRLGRCDDSDSSSAHR